MPIILKGEVIGVIGVAHPNVGAFTMDDQRDLESIAAFASVAIENAKHNEKQYHQAVLYIRPFGLGK